MAPMFDRLREMLRSAAVGKVLTRGVKAYKDGRLEEARAAVEAVLAADDVATGASGRTHRMSMRLIATTMRAEIAAKQGDDATARSAIHDGLALWEEFQEHPRGPGLESTESFASWERWARAWLARTP